MDYTNKTFTDEEVTIDGNSFKNCTLIRCRVVYSGTGRYDISGLRLTNSGITLKGPAGNTMLFLANLYKAGARELVENTIDYHIRGISPSATTEADSTN
jgi:hypothetical protein